MKLELSLEPTNTTEEESLDPCNYIFEDQQNFPTVFIYILHTTQIFLSSAAILLNYFVVAVLFLKPSLSGTEILLCQLASFDGTYGLYMFAGAFLSLLNFWDKIKCVYPVASCLIRYAMHTFFIFSNLSLVLAVTINRYVAADRPYDYKLWCKKRRITYVALLTIVVGGVFTLPEICLCCGDPASNAKWETQYVKFWGCAKAALVAACFVLSSLLYRSISKQFRTRCFPFAPVEQELNDTRRSRLESEKTKLMVQNAARTNMCDLARAESTRASTVSVIKVSRSDGNQNGNNLTANCSGVYNGSQRQNTRPVPLVGIELQSYPPLERENSKGTSNEEHQNNGEEKTTAKGLTEDTIQHESSLDNNGAQSPVGLNAFETNSPSSQKQRVTFTLFYVTLLFVVISAPDTVTYLLQEVFEFIKLGPVTSQILTMSTETLYCGNFVLSATLFIANNSYLHDKFRTRLGLARKENMSVNQ